VISYQIEIDCWIESEESRLVQVDAGFKKRQIGTRDDYAGVDKLFTVYLWYDSNYGIVIPEFIGHE
jgi:hypothetical protein